MIYLIIIALKQRFLIEESETSTLYNNGFGDGDGAGTTALWLTKNNWMSSYRPIEVI